MYRNVMFAAYARNMERVPFSIRLLLLFASATFCDAELLINPARMKQTASAAESGLDGAKRSDRLSAVRVMCRAESTVRSDEKSFTQLLKVIEADVDFAEDPTLAEDIYVLIDNLAIARPTTPGPLRALIQLSDLVIQQRIWHPPEQRSTIDDRLQRVVDAIGSDGVPPEVVVQSLLDTRQLYAARPDLQQRVDSLLPTISLSLRVEACGRLLESPNRTTARRAIPHLIGLPVVTLEAPLKSLAAKHAGTALAGANSDAEVLGLLRLLVALGPDAQPALSAVRRLADQDDSSAAKLAKQALPRLCKAIAPVAADRLAQSATSRGELNEAQRRDLVALIQCDAPLTISARQLTNWLTAECDSARSRPKTPPPTNNDRTPPSRSTMAHASPADPASDTIAVLIEALGLIGDGDAIGALVKAIRDKSLADEHRRLAAIALARCGRPGAVALVGLLDDAQAHAVQGLARTSDTALELLSKAVDQPPNAPNVDRQLLAIESLRLIGPRAAGSYESLLAWAEHSESPAKTSRSPLGQRGIGSDQPGNSVAVSRSAFTALRAVDPKRAAKHYQGIVDTAIRQAPRANQKSYSIPPLADEAIRELGQQGEAAAAAIPSLLIAARTRWSLQHEAIQALRNLGPVARSTLPELKRLRDGETTPERKRLCEDAITAIDTGQRTWRAQGGATTSAEYVKHEGGQVTLRRDNGALVAIPLEQLVEEDQRYVLARD